MLRTTISKIRRVCTVAFLPKSHRDVRKPPGKFEKFTDAAVYRTQYRSKSDARDQDDVHSKRIVEFAFASNKPSRKRRNRFVNPDERTETFETRRDSSARVHMSQFDKPDEQTEALQTKINSSTRVHMNQFNPDEPIEALETKRDLSTRVQMNQFVNTDETTEALEKERDSSTRVHINLETECEKCEKLIAKVFGVDHHDKSHSKHVGEKENDLQEIHLHATRKDEETYPDIDSAGSQKRANIGRSGGTIETLQTPYRILENMAHVNMAGNKKTNKQIVDPEVHTSEIYNKDELNKEIEATILRATTEKEDNERLAQRLEKIDESPMVNKIPTIEGFNVTPRTLEQKAKTNFSDTTDKANLSVEKIEGEKLDELASRCVNAPDDEIDERLLKEMESLKTSQPYQTTKNPIHEEEVAKMEMIKDERHIIEQSHMDLEERQEENKPADFNILQRLYPTFDGFLSERESHEDPISFKPERIFTEEKPIYYEHPTVGFEGMEQLKSETLEGHMDSNRPRVYPNQVLIDPYDKRTLAFDHEENDDTNTYEHVSVKEEPMEQIGVIPEIDKAEEIPHEPQKEHFDPKYVVTCNETCPISAEGLSNTALNSETGVLKGTEAIYDDLASSNLKENAFKQVAVENKLENNISDSWKEHELVKSGAKPIIAAAEAERNEKKNIIPVPKDENEGVESGDKPIMASAEAERDETANNISESMDENEVIESGATPIMATAEAESDEKANMISNSRDEDEVVESGATPIMATAEAERDEKANMISYSRDADEVVESGATPIMATAEAERDEKANMISYSRDADEVVESGATPIMATAEAERDEKANMISESRDENEVIELGAKPIMAAAEADEKEIPKSAEEEVKEEITIEQTQEENIHNTLEKPNLSEEGSTDTSEKDLRMRESMRRNIAANCSMPSPRLNDDQVSLSELLRRVRQRNYIEFCKAVDIGSTTIEHLGSQAAVVEPEIGKCGKKVPPCPPPAPKCPPPDPCKRPSPCPPKSPCPAAKPKSPCPAAKPKSPCPPCPPKKDPCAKFSKCAGFGVPNLISMFLQSQMFPSLPLPVTTFNLTGSVIDDTILNEITVTSVIKEEIVVKLQNIGEVFFGNCQVRKLISSESCKFQSTTQRDRFAVKDFEPWTPIPSWPIPQKEIKRPFVCPKEGCKTLPPPKLNPPCSLNPCINFPKRTFSLAEFLLLLFNKTKLSTHE